MKEQRASHSREAISGERTRNLLVAVLIASQTGVIAQERAQAMSPATPFQQQPPKLIPGPDGSLIPAVDPADSQKPMPLRLIPGPEGNLIPAAPPSTPQQDLPLRMGPDGGLIPSQIPCRARSRCFHR